MKRIVLGTTALFITLILVVSSAHEEIQESAVQTTCPVLEGKPIDINVFTDYKGKRVFFCCRMCQGAFVKSPEKYVAKLPQFAGSIAETDRQGHDVDHSKSSNFSRTIRFIGKFHPMAVHFPIALVLAAALAEIIAMLTKREFFVNASRFSIVLAASGAVVATLMGISAGHAATYSGELAHSFLMHRWFGIAVSLLIVITAFISECAYHRKRTVLKTAYRVILAVCALLVIVTACYGGQLVHGLGHYSW